MLGEKLDEIYIERDYSYTKPLVRGMLMNFDHELQIWDEMLKRTMKLDENNLSFGKLRDYMLNITFPVFSPMKLREKLIEVMFEYYGFGGFYPVTGPEMIQVYAKQNLKNKIDPKFQLIVESSHSGTYIVPFFDGEMVNYGIKKIDVGGKLLTNFLKERISFRHLDLSQEYKLVNDIKEKMCFISTNFNEDMRKR
jgi:actin-related protein 6